MSDIELAYMPATELARLIREKRLSPVDVVRNALERIEEVNPTLNCFCFVYADEALAQARRAEAAVMAGEALGALHGVPIAFKDMTPTKGKRTTLGSYVFENWVPEYDAAVVERLTGAGAIMIGKTNTSEFAFSFFTETPLWGITRNPWNPERTPGGSSGGSAAAVAAGCVPLAEGCDMGGSVRLPASFCGIAGLKPSFGRIPFDILPSQFDTFCHFGPLARHVSDAALFLALAEGPDDRDFLSLPARDALVLPPPTDIQGLRVALSIDLGYNAVDPEVEANTRAAAEVLRSLGATVDEVEIGWTRAVNEAGWLHWNVYTAMFAAEYLDAYRERMDPSVVTAIEEGLKASAVDFKRVEVVRSEQWNTIAPIFADYETLICPTTSLPAPAVGSTEDEFGGDDEDGRFHHYEMTFAFNMISACPALSVPSGFTAAGLPTGLQIAGRRFDDATVLRIGAALEGALAWPSRRPDL
jgi:Asp-tRNA(Asn)/Glu-tRNA(Gln) amidotransferase A subunit family amidase